MRYSDGTEVRQGDRVGIWGVDEGIVVFSIDTNEYSADFPEHIWSDLEGGGIMVKTDKGALVHIDTSDAEHVKRR